jgi:hypothetical protein
VKKDEELSGIKLHPMICEGMPQLETFEKCLFLFKFKEGDNFNHRNTFSIFRIKI